MVLPVEPSCMGNLVNDRTMRYVLSVDETIPASAPCRGRLVGSDGERKRQEPSSRKKLTRYQVHSSV